MLFESTNSLTTIQNDRLLTLDTKALNHILMHNYIYQRPESARYNFGHIVGRGVLVAEGDMHKLQRKVMVCMENDLDVYLCLHRALLLVPPRFAT